MKYLSLVATALLMGVVAGCKRPNTGAAKAVPAVSVSKKMSEADLAVVTLTPEAEKRLGIETIPVATRLFEPTRSYAGELMLPLTRGGTSNNSKEDRSIFSLVPAMTSADLTRTAQAQVDADGAVTAAKVQLEAAQLALKRAEELIAAKSGIGRTIDEARTQVGLTEAALRTAQERRALLGAPIFDAVKANALWVRVSVYVGDLAQLKLGAPATIRAFGADAKQPGLPATAVSVPLSASANPLISELFYEVKAGDVGLRPGLKVNVSLPAQGDEESRVVPSSAILYDVHGNTWIYENIGAQAFTRRRVEVRRILGVDAILSRGPKPGAKIVTAGAMELFGTEFGAGK
jgi:multidrug efflux pump subunit AcrA (membrane-fusion protein)